MGAVEIRQACREYAEEYIDIQREEFQRLGVGGHLGAALPDDELAYEAEIARAFGGFYGKDLVYQALKSVRWCFTDRTALAEAELEYEERDGPGDLRRVSGRAIRRSPDRCPAPTRASSIWTTTPWTIPSNVAIAVHPDETYALVEAGRRATSSSPRSSLERVAKAAGWTSWKVAATLPGHDASIGLALPPSACRPHARRAHARGGRGARSASCRRLRHDGHRHRPRPHGARPRRGRLPDRPARGPADPLARGRGRPLHDGREVPGQEGPRRQPGDRRGPRRPPARSSRYDPKFRHEYPHCWRCKNPVIFRATVQWFVRLDDPTTDVRQGALDAIAKVTWIPPGARSASPAWSRTGASGSSRGSAAGAPRSRCSTRCATASAPRSIRGATRPAEQQKFFDARRRHLPRRRAATPGTRGRPRTSCRPARTCAASPGDFEKETDILDVWFDSGVSHMAVLRSGEWPELVAPGRTAARRPLPRGPRPAPRLVPVVAADLRRALRRRAVPTASSRTASSSTARAARCRSRSATSSRRRT